MSVAERWAAVQAAVRAAAAGCGRDPDAVRIVAVSKRHSVEAIREAASAGVAIVGENYVQEMLGKMDALDLPGLSWHYIGHLQRNKVKGIVGRVDLIHAVDSERLVDEIGKRAALAGVTQKVLVAVNVADEDSKSGVSPDACAALVRHIEATEGVRCVGLMTMPPLPENPEQSRPYFRRLRELADRLRESVPGLVELSMGTTGDYQVAIEEGATLVRIGTAIFGPRSAPEGQQ